jgi:hypothetical protein
VKRVLKFSLSLVIVMAGLHSQIGPTISSLAMVTRLWCRESVGLVESKIKLSFATEIISLECQ